MLDGIFLRNFSLAEQRPISGRKGKQNNEDQKTILAAVFLLGAIGPSVPSAAAAASVISKDAFTDSSYCHMKLPAIRERTFGTAQPVLTETDSGDIIDFYGPCSHDPLGKDEIHAQLLERQHRKARDYMD